jgi:hypothetical protein
MTNFPFRSLSALAVTGLTVAFLAPVAQATNEYFPSPAFGSSFDAGVTSNAPFTIGVSSFLPGQRMLLDMTGMSTVTFTIRNADPQFPPSDFSGAECSFSDSASQPDSTDGVSVNATFTSTPSANSVTCTLTSTGLTGSRFFVRVPGSPLRVSGEIRFFLNNFSRSGSGTRALQNAAPIKYSGPEFSSLSLKPVLNGSGTTLEGRKLDQISSITIDGKAAKLSDATDKSLKLELPAGLKPGVYDLVVNTASHGKLTHMNAIRIREVMPDTSLTIKGSGVLSGEEFKKLTAFSRTQNPDMNTVTCIVNSGSEGKSFMQARALCDRISATNLNIKNTKFEARSTVEGSAIFARVVFSSEQ